MINDLNLVQWDYLLSPEFELINSAGKPLTGGYIEVYIHGTRDKYYCALSFDGTLHPFQIPLDALGSNIVLAEPTNAYDVYVYNKYGSLVMSRYNVHCQGGNGGSSTYVGDKLFYGQYRASNVTTIANLRRNKGNINLTSNGYLKLKNGMSYHITVRGAFTVDNTSNVDTTLNYIEYSSINPIKVDVDYTKEGPQYFELSYDLYRLPEDMDYQVAFDESNGMVTDLIVEVHSLSNLATSSAGGGQEYEEGWGIDITNNVISVDPSILDDYVTEEELLEIVTGITGIIPEDVATHTEVYEATVTAIEYVTGIIPEAHVQSNWDETDDTQPSYIQNKPDIKDLVEGTNIRFREEEDAIYIDAVVTAIPTVTGFATHEEVYESSVTSVQLATAQIPDSEEVEFEEIDLNDYALASAIPDISNLATKSEVYNSDVTAIQFVTGLIPDVSNLASKSDVYNSNVTAIQFVTALIPDIDESDIYNATVTAVQTATAQIPDSEEVQFEEINLADYALASAIPVVTGYATHSEVYNATVTAIDFVTAIIPEAQVQSDWTEEDNTDPAYILNKPTEKLLLEGDNIRIRETNAGVYIDAIVTAIPVVTGFTTNSDVYNATVTAVQLATSLIPEEQVQSDWNVTAVDSPAYIKNKPEILETLPLKAGDNISLEVDEGELVIAVTGEMGRTYTAGDYVSIQNDVISVTGVAAATAIPEQVQSDWAATGVSDPDYIKNKPEITPLIEGSNIHFTETAEGIMISASMPPASGTVTEVEVYNATVTAVQLATGQIPDVSDFVTEDQVTALLPDTEDVQFEEINLSDYALASAIPDVTNLASKAEVYNSVVTGVQLATAQIPDVTGFATKAQVYNATVTAIDTVTSIIPEAQVQSDWNVTAIDSPAYIKNKPEIFENMPLKAGEGIGISIDNDEVIVAVTAQYLTEIPSTYATDTEVYNATVTAVQLATAQIPDSEEVQFEEINLSDYALASAIPDISDMATQTWVGNQGFLTSIPSTYATDTEVNNAVVTGIQAATGWTDAQNYLTSVPNTYATKTYVDSSVTGLQTKLTGINDVQIVASLPANPTSSTLYLIPEV